MLTKQIIEIFITPGVLVAIFILLWRSLRVVVRAYKRNRYIEKFSDYRSVLEYHMEKAYDMIHKEHILTYSLDAYRIDDKDYDRISKEFVRLVAKFVGPSLLGEFIYLYGDVDTFSFNILEYFSTKYENDEIRNTAMEQITEEEIDEKSTSTTPMGTSL